MGDNHHNHFRQHKQIQVYHDVYVLPRDIPEPASLTHFKRLHNVKKPVPSNASSCLRTVN